MLDAASDIRCDDAGSSLEPASSMRFDAGTLGKLERTPTGGVRVPARVTRSGVLVYQRADGSQVREWRPPEEVFHEDSLRTLADAAVTIGHPPSGRVTPASFRADAVGYIRESGRRDGTFVSAPIVVQDGAAIDRIDGRDLVELSSGYSCTVEMKSGVTPDGERYDAIQRGIKYNHVALLPRGGGRAGRDVALRVDGAAIEITEPARPAPNGDAPTRVERRDTMKTERIDGIEYEIGTTAWSQARERHDSKLATDLAAAEKRAKDAEAAAVTARADADAHKLRIAALEAELAPAKLDARVAERSTLVERVRSVLGADTKLDGKSDVEIMQLAIAKLDPDFKLDSIAETSRETYVRARFEAEMRHVKKPSPVVQARGDAFGGVPPGQRPDLSAYLVKPGDRI